VSVLLYVATLEWLRRLAKSEDRPKPFASPTAVRCTSTGLELRFHPVMDPKQLGPVDCTRFNLYRAIKEEAGNVRARMLKEGLECPTTETRLHVSGPPSHVAAPPLSPLCLLFKIEGGVQFDTYWCLLDEKEDMEMQAGRTPLQTLRVKTGKPAVSVRLSRSYLLSDLELSYPLAPYVPETWLR